MPSQNPRKLVTAAVADYLKAPDQSDPPAFLTGARGRVFDNDDTPPDASDMNEINVVFVSETIDPVTQHQDGRRRRIMRMQIECYNSTSKAAADDLAWEVEEAIRANPTLGNMLEWMKLTDVGLFVVENDTYALFSVVMTYEVIYWTHVVEDVSGVPVTIFLGVEPDVGPGNEDDYTAIT